MEKFSFSKIIFVILISLIPNIIQSAEQTEAGWRWRRDRASPGPCPHGRAAPRRSGRSTEAA